jgi:hypothetical protein
LKNNLVFTGLRETVGEEMEAKLGDFLRCELNIDYYIEFGNVHRFGSRQNNTNDSKAENKATREKSNSKWDVYKWNQREKKKIETIGNAIFIFMCFSFFFFGGGANFENKYSEVHAGCCWQCYLLSITFWLMCSNVRSGDGGSQTELTSNSRQRLKTVDGGCFR